MNYSGKKVAITGADGFIGSALLEQLDKLTDDGDRTVQKVFVIKGDIRDPKTFNVLNHRIDYLFHFAAPSSQVLFKRQAMYATETTIVGFINAARACKQNGIKLIYPSTGLLSSNRYNEYAMCKKICEDIAASEKLDALGIRIFATYGPGESHKRDYASVPYLFARDMIEGKSPVIFGDGEQVRDFIYIDDVVQAILRVAEECNDPVIDVGSGVQISFNSIIKELSRIIGPVKPVYVDKPGGYVSETMAHPEELDKYYTREVAFAEGISKLVKELQK